MKRRDMSSRQEPWAAWYSFITEAGTRPRALICVSCALAHSRTADVSVRFRGARARGGLPDALRACSMYRPSELRRACAFWLERSISYEVPFKANRTVWSAGLPSMSSSRMTWTRYAITPSLAG